MADRPSERFATLDGIRGVAALVIVAYHEFRWLGPLTPQGGFLAVDLFFVLSGFVIARAYGRRMADGSLSVWDFFRVRAIRLYPLFFLGLMMGAGLATLSLIQHRQIVPMERAAWWSFVPGLFMLPGPPLSAGTPLYPIDTVFWSLLFELLVNVLYAFTRRFWTPVTIVASMVLSGAVILATGAQDFTGWDWGSFGMDVVRVMYSFPAGVLIWQLYERGWRTPVLPGPLVLLTLAPCFLWNSGIAIELSTLVAFPLIVYLGAQTKPSGALAWISVQLGLASYAIYVLHYRVIDGLSALIAKFNNSPSWLPLGLAAVFPVATVFAALAIDRFYDAPIRAALGRIDFRNVSRKPLPRNSKQT